MQAEPEIIEVTMDIEEVKPAPVPVSTPAPVAVLQPSVTTTAADAVASEGTPESAAVRAPESIVYVEKVVERLIEIPAKPLSAVVGALAGILASQPTGCSVPELCSTLQKLNLSISQADVCV